MFSLWALAFLAKETSAITDCGFDGPIPDSENFLRCYQLVHQRTQDAPIWDRKSLDIIIRRLHEFLGRMDAKDNSVQRELTYERLTAILDIPNSKCDSYQAKSMRLIREYNQDYRRHLMPYIEVLRGEKNENCGTMIAQGVWRAVDLLDEKVDEKGEMKTYKYPKLPHHTREKFSISFRELSASVMAIYDRVADSSSRFIQPTLTRYSEENVSNVASAQPEPQPNSEVVDFPDPDTDLIEAARQRYKILKTSVRKWDSMIDPQAAEDPVDEIEPVATGSYANEMSYDSDEEEEESSAAVAAAAAATADAAVQVEPEDDNLDDENSGRALDEFVPRRSRKKHRRPYYYIPHTIIVYGLEDRVMQSMPKHEWYTSMSDLQRQAREALYEEVIKPCEAVFERVEKYLDLFNVIIRSDPQVLDFFDYGTLNMVGGMRICEQLQFLDSEKIDQLVKIFASRVPKFRLGKMSM